MKNNNFTIKKVVALLLVSGLFSTGLIARSQQSEKKEEKSSWFSRLFRRKEAANKKMTNKSQSRVVKPAKNADHKKQMAVENKPYGRGAKKTTRKRFSFFRKKKENQNQEERCSHGRRGKSVPQ